MSRRPARNAWSGLEQDARDGRAALLQALVGDGGKFKVLQLVDDAPPRFHAYVSNPHTAVQRMADGYMVVAPAAPDLVAVDLDGCATPRVLDALDALVGSYDGHPLVDLLTLSGSPDSAHRYYVVPAARRAGLRDALVDFRTRYGLDGYGGGTLEDRTADGVNWRGCELRMPYSPSKKPGRPAAVPADRGGLVLDAWDAVARLYAARALRDLPPVPAAARVDAPPVPAAALPARRAAAAPSAGVVAPDVARSVQGWAAGDRDAVLCHPARGTRSHAALKGLRVVVRNVGSCWDAVRGYVMALPVFGKYAGDGERRARLWWERTAAAYLAWCERHPRAAVATAGDRRHVDLWWQVALRRLRELYSVETSARLLLGLVAIARHRMLDGGGLVSRPVAVRDLVVWGVAADGWAGGRLLRGLQSAGLLVLARDYDRRAPGDAREWSLPALSDLRKGTRRHTYSQGGGATGAPLPPSPAALWLQDGPVLWLAYTLAAGGSSSAAGLAATLGCSARAARSWLGRLGRLGLLARTGGLWLLTDLLPDATPGAAAARGVLAQRVELVEVERGLHAALVARPRRAGRPAGGVMAAARRAARAFGAAADAAAPAAPAAPTAPTGSWGAVPDHRGELLGAAAGGVGPPGRAGPADEPRDLLLPALTDGGMSP